jgi:hypothetical protein
VRQGRRPGRRRPRQHHQPPGTLDDRHPALQRQGADDAVRAAGLARPPGSFHHAALRQDHPEHADKGVHPGRVLRPQHPHHRDPARPGCRHLRCRRGRPALAALRPGPRVLLLHLLRAMPAPDGLRPLRLLHPERLQPGPPATETASCGQGSTCPGPPHDDKHPGLALRAIHRRAGARHEERP